MQPIDNGTNSFLNLFKASHKEFGYISNYDWKSPKIQSILCSFHINLINKKNVYAALHKQCTGKFQIVQIHSILYRVW